MDVVLKPARVNVVGVSGSGKSTRRRYLEAMSDPQHHNVTFVRFTKPHQARAWLDQFNETPSGARA